VDSGFRARAMAPNGTRLGGWLLHTDNDHFAAIGDFDGDGRGEVLVTSPWGIGVLERSGEGWNSPFLTANGTRVGGWMVDSTSNRFQAVGDLDRDGRTELLVTSPWGIGIMKKVGDTLTCPLLLPNGTRIGGWLLNTADNAFPIAADFDRDGCTELLVKSPWGIAVLRFDGAHLSTALIASNGTRFGDWQLDTAVDRFELTADMDGDGHHEVLVTSPSGVGLLAWRNDTFTTIANVPSGSWIGPWRLETDRNRFGPAAAIGDTGRTEVLLASPWGIGVLAWKDGGLVVPALAPNDSRLGDWRLNTRDNRFNVTGDFDGAGKGRVLITSPWGIGLLRRVGAGLAVSPMVENGTALGDWRLNTRDNDIEAGAWRGTALVIFHDAWKWAIDQARPRWLRRGLAVEETDKAATGLARLRALATTARPGDRVFVHIAGHGSDPRPAGNTDPSHAANHAVGLNSGFIWVHQVAPLFEVMANRGVDLSVLDGSCNGGETVLQATGQRYCAIATTGVNSPGLTGFPVMHDALDVELKPSSFSLWWAEPRSFASALNSIIVRGVPSRFHQRLHRNDQSPLANVFYRTALDRLKALDHGGWYLHYLYCYLYPHIYPTEYAALDAAEKAKFTNDTQTYVDTIDKMVDAYRPTIAAFDAVLADTSLMGQAAPVYVHGFTAAWRALAGDGTWDVLGSPELHMASLADLSPRDWQGTAGFAAIVAELRASITQMLAWYVNQRALLWEIDAAVQSEAPSQAVLLPPIEAKILPLRSPSDPRYYQEFNLLDQDLSKRSRAVRAKALGLSRRARLAPNWEKELSRVKTLLKGGSQKSLALAVAGFKAITVVHLAALGRASFLLSLVEDAVAGAVSGGGAHPGDVNLI
jgi:hypothetical protein